MLGVYIHVPFCEKKCSYCAFSSFSDFSQKGKYITSLCDEIEGFYRKGERIDTIYIGGGTPSVLNEDEITKIFSSLKKTFVIDDKCEITIECNPNSTTKEKLLAYKSLGVNRLSIGVQSLNDDDLKFAGRLHTGKEALKKIELAKEVGFKNISIDLLIGLPYSSEEEYEKNLQTIVGLGITHISTYMLQIEDNTPLKSMVLKNPSLLPDDDNLAEFASKTANFLKKSGFLHYEVSNYALKGYESKHNLKYWTGEEYVGFGLSAHSYLEGKRIANANDFDDYYKRKISGAEVLTQAQKIEEHIMLGLRCSNGIDKEYLKSQGFDIGQNEYYKDFVARGILKVEGQKVYLSEDYYFVNNFIIVSLLP